MGSAASATASAMAPRKAISADALGAMTRRDAGNEPTLVRQPYRKRRPGGPAQPAAEAAAARRKRQRSTDGGELLAGRAEQRHVGAEARRQPRDGALLNLARRLRRRNELGGDLAGELERPVERRYIGDEVPDHAGRKDDQNQAADDGEVDLKVEAPHACALANR